jgi:hypothetical protein
MNLQVIKIRVFAWLKRVVLYGAYLTLTFLVVAFFLLQLPAVQKMLVGRYTRQFSEVSGFTIRFDKIYLRWYDRLELDGLSIVDPEQDTMIAVNHMSVNFRLSSLLENNDINIDGVDMKGAQVHLKTIDETPTLKNLNIDVFIHRLSGKSSGGGNPPKIHIGEIDLENSKFSLNETESDSIKNGFDYHHFKVNIEADLEAFRVIGDTIDFRLNSLQAKDQRSGLEIVDLRTYFLISQTSMEFLGLNLTTAHSHVTDTVILTYKSQADLSDFNNKVNIKAKLKETHIDPLDLALFNDGQSPLPEPLFISGEFTGKISRFMYRKMNVQLGKTNIEGSLQMDGLPTIKDTFIELAVKKGSVDIRDLAFLLPNNYFNLLKPLGQFRLTGTFTGYVSDFVADGDFMGSLGRIQSDINLKINQKEIEKSTYSGNLALTNFDLGTYFKDTTNFQKVTLNGQIKGTGLTEKSADFLLRGNIQSLGIRKYNYTNISTNARFASQLFNGELVINDPNLQFNVKGSVDLRKGVNLVKLKAKLDTANFHELGFIKDPLFISTYLDIDTKGLQIDSLFGDAVFRETRVKYRDKELALDSLHINSQHNNNQRQLYVRSSLADVELNGSYYYSTLFNDFSKLFKEFMLNVKNNKADIQSYYAKKDRSVQEYDANFKIKLNNINPIFDLAHVDVQISKGTQIKGKFTNGITSILQAFTTIDSVTVEGKHSFGNDIELSGSKIRDSVNVLTMLTVNSQKQRFSNSFQSQNLFAELIWNKGHANFTLDADQVGTTNMLRLQSEIDFLHDSTKIKILPTRLRALDKEWSVNPQNYLLNNGAEWSIHNLELVNGSESIAVNGEVSQKSEPTVTLQIKNFNLDILNTISSEKFNGIMNGEVIARDLYHSPYFQNNFSVSEFKVNSFLIGDLNGSSRAAHSFRRRFIRPQ